jgi:hypothetical protein
VVAANDACHGGEDRPVVGCEPWMWMLAVQNGELVAQDEDLDVLGMIGAAAQHQQVEDQADETVETRHGRILAASEPVPIATAKPQVTAPGRVFGTDRCVLRSPIRS